MYCLLCIIMYYLYTFKIILYAALLLVSEHSPSWSCAGTEFERFDRMRSEKDAAQTLHISLIL